MDHHVKLLPRWYDLSAQGLKPWEMRVNDRDYKVGDFLVFGEWSETTGYTGRGHQAEISAVVPGVPHLPEDWVVLSLLEPLSADEYEDEEGRYWGNPDGVREPNREGES